MGLALWIALFAVLSALCAWVVFGNAIDSVLGVVVAALLGADVSRWSEAGIRFFVASTWALLAVWFILGLVSPQWRF